MGRIEELEGSLHHHQQTIDTKVEQLNGLLGQLDAHAAAANQASAEGLSANNAKLREAVEQADPVDAADWRAPSWDNWQPEIRTDTWYRVRVGAVNDKRSNTLLSPEWIPFIGGPGSTVIRTAGGQGATTGAQLLQSLLMRTAALLPHHCVLHLLDPGGGGKAFPMARHLPNVERGSSDLRRDLDVVTDQIRRIIETYLDASTPTFHELGEAIRLSESFHLVFAADFPNRYDSRAIESLNYIAETGPTAGVHLFVHHHLDHAPPNDMAASAFPAARVLDLRQRDRKLEGVEATFVPDAPPDGEQQQKVLNRLVSSAPREVAVPWTELSSADPDTWWQESSIERIEAPIGTAGVAAPLNVVFGVDGEGRPVAHGIVAASTGGGKSTFLHALITSLAVRYAPSELQLYLVDGKFGTEMADYRDLPHAAVVSLRTQPEMARSVLSDLVEELERRNALFQDAAVADLTAYRRQGHELARILLVVDEYQQFFEDDDDSTASDDLKKLAEQGRSAGVHILMGSQRFTVPKMRYRDAIFGNIHLRVAMQMMDEDVRALTEFGPKGRSIIEATCDRPGKIVLNARGGDDAANRAGRVALLDSDLRAQLIKQLCEKSRQAGRDDMPIVFNGASLPTLSANAILGRLRGLEDWPSREQLQDLARLPVAQNGLGIGDWLNGEQPLLACFGREFNVRGYATIALRRRPGEVITIVAPDGNVRTGVAATTLLGAVLTHDPQSLCVAILDHSVPQTEWSGVLGKSVADAIERAGFDVRVGTTDESSRSIIADLNEELRRRQALSGEELANEPSWLIVANDLDRVMALNHTEDLYGSEPTEDGLALNQLITSGPVSGMHTVIAAQAVGSLMRVVTRNVVAGSRYRVAQQLSEDHSFELMQSNAASKVMRPGDTLEAVLVLDTQSGQARRFMPHVAHRTDDLPNLVAEIDEEFVPVLAGRNHKRTRS